MKHHEAKHLTGRHNDDILGRRYMDKRGAFSDPHEAKTAGYSPVTHRYPHPGYDYTAVLTSRSKPYGLYSLWARKIKDFVPALKSQTF
jgi:hypothetical protein